MKKNNNTDYDSNTHSTDKDGEGATAYHIEQRWHIKVNKFDCLTIIHQGRMFFIKKKMGYSLNKSTFRI